MNGQTESPSVPDDGYPISVPSAGPHPPLPETKITVFALKLAILEKVASGLGKLAFIWATVVLLGGFAVTLKTVDFWFVTIILLTEGARIFSRSQEVVWHHETMLTSMAILSGEAKRLIHRFKEFFGCLTSNEENSGVDHDYLQKRTWAMSMIRLLFYMQLLSVLICVALSLYRLVKQHYSVDSGSDKRNLKPALMIFYSLSFSESFLFLVEKAYLQWKINVSGLLTKVNNEYHFDQPELETVQRFLCDTYSRCINGSVFDGLKMEFVSHSVELLQSSSADGQLAGARVLSELARKKQFEEKTLMAIGTRRDAVERLIDMLHFKNHHEQEIRKAAAQIFSKLVENKRDCIRVTAIDGMMESIASLLYSNDSSPKGFVWLGLTILQKLAEERSNRDKIGSRGLLSKIIALIDLELEKNPLESPMETEWHALQSQREPANPVLEPQINTAMDAVGSLRNGVHSARESKIETSKLALELVSMLASTTGSTGKCLRRRIQDIVFAISNLRDVLDGEISRPDLQILAIDTLTSLAREKVGRERIGSTGGVLDNLFSLFFKENINNNDETKKLVQKAGEALGFLSLENEYNCEIMRSIKQDGPQNIIARLISVKNDTLQGIPVARILRNLLAYPKTDDVELCENVFAEQVQKIAREDHSCEHQEAAKRLEADIGFAAQLFKIMTPSKFHLVFNEQTGITKKSLICKLVNVLQSHPCPSKDVPNIRRFSIELLRAVMKRDEAELEMGSDLVKALGEALEGVLKTTSDWEYYSAFSGSVGLSRHRKPIRSLVQSAMKLLPK